MFSRRTLRVWVGIMLLSGMFLMGQETWAPPACVDNDGDGYGSPTSASCTYPELDCDDTVPAINPGATEVCDGVDNNCADGIDEEPTASESCNDSVDCTVDSCNPATQACDNIPNDALCDDSDVCTTDACNPTSGGCTHVIDKDSDTDGYIDELCTGGTDCDDTNPAVHPGATEGPYGDPVCSDTLDNDCDGDTDVVDGGCRTTGMALIPGGCFDMGDPFNEGGTNERPVHNVCISTFEMDVHEVTNAEYAECVAGGRCTAPSPSSSYSRSTYYGNPAYDDFPVIYVNWYQTTDYCTWAGKRLPTEAEWEYAARGGLSGKRYPWGDTISGTDANYWNSGDPWDNDTSEVEYYGPQGYGLYDMAGNVWEWVNDWYQSNYYTVSPPNDPPGPGSGTSRVLRGGSWSASTSYLRVARRSDYLPGLGGLNLGFRCARGGAYGP